MLSIETKLAFPVFHAAPQGAGRCHGAAVMRGYGRGQEDHLPSLGQDALAKVDVLEVDEESLVESSGLEERRAPDEEEGPAHPTDLAAAPVVPEGPRPKPVEEGLLRELGEEARPAAERGLERAGRREEGRADNAGVPDVFASRS